jgi:hypothetical protein
MSKTVGHGMVSVIVSIVIFIFVCMICRRSIFFIMILHYVIDHTVV